MVPVKYDRALTRHGHYVSQQISKTEKPKKRIQTKPRPPAMRTPSM